MKKVRVLIVDDHKMIREGVSAMISLYNDRYNFIIDLADTGELAIKKTRTNPYELVIMDYQLPGINGVESVKEIRKQFPKMKILALSNYDEYANICSMFEAGVDGFILKNIGSDELLLAIENVLSGKKYYSNEVAIKLIDNKPLAEEVKKRKSGGNTLSERELQILHLITLEYTNGKIAEKLKLSKRTIDKHRQHLLEKLDAKNTVGLIKRAIELNLLTKYNRKL